MMSVSSPPYRSGKADPWMPKAAHFFQSSREKTQPLSLAITSSFSAVRANLTALSLNSSCSALNSKFTAGPLSSLLRRNQRHCVQSGRKMSGKRHGMELLARLRFFAACARPGLAFRSPGFFPFYESVNGMKGLKIFRDDIFVKHLDPLLVLEVGHELQNSEGIYDSLLDRSE